MMNKAFSKAILAAAALAAFPLFPCSISPQTQVSLEAADTAFGVFVAGNSTAFTALWRRPINQVGGRFSLDYGQTWGAPFTFGSAVVSLVSACANSASFVAAWIQGTEAGQNVQTNFAPAATLTWGTPVTVATASNVLFVRAAATNAGFMTVWSQTMPFSVRSSFSANGATWGAPVTIPSSFTPTRVDVAGNGNGFLASFTDNMANLGYVSFSSDNGASWGSQVLVASIQNGTTLGVGGNAAGFLAAWVEPMMQRIFTSFSSDNGATWSSPVQIDSAIGTSNTYVTVAGTGLASSGFVVTWVNGSSNAQASCSGDQGETWGDPVTVNTAPASVPTGPASAVGVGIVGSHAVFGWKDFMNNAWAAPGFVPVGGVSFNGSQFFKQITPNNPGRRLN